MQSTKLEVRGVGSRMWAAVFAGVLTFTMAVPAQSPPSGPPITEPWPQEIGQWAGPWNLQQSMVRDPQGVAYDPAVTEIAHSMLIPPREPGLLGQSPYKGWVLFMNRRAYVPTGGSTTGPQPTFLWNPDVPGMIEDQHHVYLPGGVAGELALDVFCSGHTYLGDGRPMTAGGQDQVDPPPLGQGQSYSLETRNADDLQTNPPYWELLGTEQALERWYPTTTTLADGNVIQLGNSAPDGSSLLDPNPDPPVLYDCQDPPGHACGDWTRSIFVYDPNSPTQGDWGPELINRRHMAANPECEIAVPMEVSHYPRLHLLTSGELIWVDGRAPGAPNEHLSYFMKVDPTSTPDCSVDTGNPFQWRQGVAAPGDTHEASQKGAPTAHLIWPGALPGSWEEVIYQFGGTIAPHDDASTCPPIQKPNESPPDRVARLLNPDTTTPWDITGVEDMEYGRVNHNAVIQLDGSILVVGGLEPIQIEDGPCAPRKRAELFLPEELFPGDPGPDGRWKDMALQTAIRGYHSVAGLLPDGRVFSAGGFWPGNRYTVELYSPPYMFRAEPRPAITSQTDVSDSLAYGSSLDVFVKLRGGGAVSRVALVRPGSTTHAFDMSQRYIVLPILNVSGTAQPDVLEVEVGLPATGAVAPPGWYMLTVVGGPTDLPSVAKWVKIE